MKTAYLILLICWLCSCITGCFRASFQSNTNPDAKPAFSRILIVSKISQVSPTYLPTLQTAFPAGYQVCTLSIGPLSFDTPEEAIERQRQACNSEVILSIDFNRSYTSGSGKSIASYNEIYMELSTLKTNKPFWKAIVTTGGSNEISPRQLVNQLLKDGIIEGEPPSGRYVTN